MNKKKKQVRDWEKRRRRRRRTGKRQAHKWQLAKQEDARKNNSSSSNGINHNNNSRTYKAPNTSKTAWISNPYTKKWRKIGLLHAFTLHFAPLPHKMRAYHMYLRCDVSMDSNLYEWTEPRFECEMANDNRFVSERLVNKTHSVNTIECKRATSFDAFFSLFYEWTKRIIWTNQW